MRAYHDVEWGRPVAGEAAHFERLTLEAFQSGLSWATILAKRPAFREAFAGFDADRVAAYDEADVARLMADARIVRNRRKIEAAIVNARATVALREDGGLERLIRSFAPEAGATTERLRGHLGGVGRPGEGPQAARFRLRRADHHLCADAGDRDLRSAPGGLSSPLRPDPRRREVSDHDPGSCLRRRRPRAISTRSASSSTWRPGRSRRGGRRRGHHAGRTGQPRAQRDGVRRLRRVPVPRHATRATGSSPAYPRWSRTTSTSPACPPSRAPTRGR